jgi:hypothetical protein|nr:MAG TPA: hypothetical protein [Caudoviricetes sp.]
MIKSSFLSCEKDTELIVKKLFFDSGETSELLKRLLIITAKDCLDLENLEYKNVIDNISIADLWSKGYISIVPKLKEFENQDLQSYIILTYGNFSMNATNPQFRDNTITFDIICPTDYWDIGDYRVRPLKIAGYIDAILDNKKLTGIGNTQFLSCQQLVLDENFSGYSLTYSVIHGNDDRLI